MSLSKKYNFQFENKKHIQQKHKVKKNSTHSPPESISGSGWVKFRCNQWRHIADLRLRQIQMQPMEAYSRHQVVPPWSKGNYVGPRPHVSQVAHEETPHPPTGGRAPRHVVISAGNSGGEKIVWILSLLEFAATKKSSSERSLVNAK